MEKLLILNFVNLLLCVFWGWAAVCRLAVIHNFVMLRVQLVYVLVFVASPLCGLQYFIWGTYAGWPDIIASIVISGMMLAGMHNWRNGPPADVLSCPAPLQR